MTEVFRLQTDRVTEALYRQIRRIRRVEERIAEIYPTDKIKSPVHLAIGQEYIPAAICQHLGEGDFVAGTYRGHGVYLAKGGDLSAMLAEMYGKRSGCAGGRGGSMHLTSIRQGIIGMSAVVGTGIPVATGYALAASMQRQASVVVCFFGDGATEEGAFLESVNFAALRKLPILYVCENNGYAIHEPLHKRWASQRLCERVATYDIPVFRQEDSDALALYRQSGEMINHLREGRGPAFMECLTYRWYEHVGPTQDYDQGYRSRDELMPWQKHDALLALAELLEPIERARMDDEIEQEIEAAIRFAELSEFPSEGELHRYVYA